MEDYLNLIGSAIFALMSFCYIQSSTTFEKPLSKKDEERYIKEYIDGNEQAKNILIERNLRLVAHIAKKYVSKTLDNEDLISIGSVGLIKGITTFNFSKGTKLTTYCAKCIENATLSIRKLIATYIRTLMWITDII